MKQDLSTGPYKGVRDFYPRDWMLQKWMFWKMADVCERYGYENYNASPLEPTELFEAKSGQEIIENETYNLVDRGDRRVTLRPEMTPTVARMVAAQSRELPRPIRWYSIPNLFRYERPQKGRLREHYQLNVDIFGVEGVEADIEVIEIGYNIMKNLGAQDGDFDILINNRKIMNALFTQYTNDKDVVYKLSKLIDKKKKLTVDEFTSSIAELLADKATEFIAAIEKSSLEDVAVFANPEDVAKTKEIMASLASKGITNARFDITLMRGFDYYTDVVFEFFDVHPDNNRSLFGGGRYNDLLDIFNMDKVPAVGFGMGDVTAKDFLEAHKIVPELESMTKVCVAPLSKNELAFAEEVAAKLRAAGVNTEIDFTYRKYDRIIASAQKKFVPFLLAIGEQEASSKQLSLKQTDSGETKTGLSIEDVIKTIHG